MNNLGYSVKAIRKASTHLTKEPQKRLKSERGFQPLTFISEKGLPDTNSR